MKTDCELGPTYCIKESCECQRAEAERAEEVTRTLGRRRQMLMQERQQGRRLAATIASRAQLIQVAEIEQIDRCGICEGVITCRCPNCSYRDAVYEIAAEIRIEYRERGERAPIQAYVRKVSPEAMASGAISPWGLPGGKRNRAADFPPSLLTKFYERLDRRGVRWEDERVIESACHDGPQGNQTGQFRSEDVAVADCADASIQA